MSTNPTVILITGPGGAGKSTTAERIAEEPGWVHLSEDDFWVRIKEGRPQGEERTADEEVLVQAQVVELMRELIASGNRVALEFILYEDPPRPLLRYQDALTDAGVTFATRVLRPSVDELLRRQDQRGRPNDRDRDSRRPGAERQHRVLLSSHIDQAHVVDTTALSADEVFDLYFRPLVVEAPRQDTV